MANDVVSLSTELILPQSVNDVMIKALAEESLQQAFTNGVLIGAATVIVFFIVGKIIWNIYSSRRGSQ